MNTEREDRLGEYWPEPNVLTFNVKKVWAWIVSLFLLVGVANAQVAYCGVDVASSFVPNGGVAKQTLSNLLIRSQEIDVAAGYTLSGVTITADNAVAPDGTTTAEKVTASVGASAKRVIATTGTNRPLSAGAGTYYRTEVYAKAGTHPYISLGDNGDDVSRGVTVNLSTCTIGLQQANVSAKSYSVGNGWCYIDMVGLRTDVCGGCKNLTFEFDLVTSATSAMLSSLTAAGTETVYIWGAQQNVATTAPADYLQTVASAATLGPLCPLGYTQSLIDPSRCFIVSPTTSRTIRTW